MNTLPSRPTISVPTLPGGWPAPWPRVAELAEALPANSWTLVGGLMTQLHTIHRFVRGTTSVDLVGSAPDDQVDVLVADHPAPRVVEKLHGFDMVRIEGGTQALRRTVNAQIEITSGKAATISVPRPFGALVLKSAAYSADSRDRERHLFDAVALLACVDDPFAEREEFTGSDRRRINTLVKHLPPSNAAWQSLPQTHRTQAQLTLEILATDIGTTT